MCLKCASIAVYLLLLGNATVPFSYGLDFVHQGYTDDFTLIDNHGTNQRHTRSIQNLHSLVLKRDNHKPVLNCSNYQASVDEESPIGSFVYKVEAYDEDHDSITYRFQQRPGERPKFKIDNSTGRITTATIFDRDDYNYKQKDFYVTVIASDNGKPTLFDVCTFKILINDVNDNPPLFDKQNYSEAIPEDLAVGNEVMRIYATDADDGKNSEVTYSLDPTSQYAEYFTIDETSGIITLKKRLPPGWVTRILTIRAVAKDSGIPSLKADADLTIKIVESKKKAPTFTELPTGPIYLPENYSTFDQPFVIIRAQSNIPDHPDVNFLLIPGRTKSTNNGPTFDIKHNQTEAGLILSEYLDYESITEYTLTIRITNDDALSAVAKIIIKVLDVNDNKPSFLELSTEEEISGSVLENEPPGTPVMSVQATDRDGTPPNNIVKYELADHQDLFSIDENTGEIRTRVEFDRETTRVYNVKVKVQDGAPSALHKTGKPNEVEQVFRIEIDDKNDNPPKFTQSIYTVDKLDESSHRNKLVIEIKADDPDTASVVQYEIIEGNIGEAFYVDKFTGKIKVGNNLDYETIPYYELKVLANDGTFNDTAIVKITLKNENDEVPVFEKFQTNITIPEETLFEGCLIQVKATDPDKRPDEDQEIIYSIGRQTDMEFLDVDKSGCVKLTKTLDRDPPKGNPQRQVLITAIDENGGPGSQSNSVSFNIHLSDINDNAPTLNQTEVVWEENKEPEKGPITKLLADDIDEPQNGPPFKFAIASDANDDIKERFDIIGDELIPLVIFDRESQKEYIVPINITDNGIPSKSGTSFLKVIIGDVNDNRMESGESNIFVNKWNNMPPTAIGRVYVKDLDDWDLPDKKFYWDNRNEFGGYFDVDPETGEIAILSDTPNGTYWLNFTVTEMIFGEEHKVPAWVIVAVKEIPMEAIKKSGSFRLVSKTAEEFVEPIDKFGSEQSVKDKVQKQLAKMMNVSLQNLDIISVLHSPVHEHKDYLDVRYSAHGSPYRYPEELDTRLIMDQERLDIFEDIFMVNVAECLVESVCPGYSCTNYFNISTDPYVINTNRTSFVGVSAFVEPKCACNYKSESDYDTYCLNGGTRLEGSTCSCEPGYEGPHCEALSVSFGGNGFTMYPPFQTCNSSTLTLEIITKQENGLIFYIGPLRRNYKLDVVDFMSLELNDGYPLLLINYGNQTAKVKQNTTRVNDGEKHTISILLKTESVQLNVDNCPTSDCISKGYTVAPGPSKTLNVNGPLQLGGSILDLKRLAAEMGWNEAPTNIKFIGCISNLTYNGEIYNLGQPHFGEHYTKDCNNLGTMAAATIGIDSNFLVALLVCFAILLVLLLAVVVHRKKHDNWNEKELDDIRETIINYEDEGGGEVDTGFDLELLRRENQFDDSHIKKQNDLYYGRADPEEVPDINSFLKDKKDACDRDPDFNPCDDVRYYAYEGDGNTSRSSLSSLASCTDEGDLKFNYLSNFGPRFRKLADMYGEDPSDEDDQDGGEESWC